MTTTEYLQKNIILNPFECLFHKHFTKINGLLVDKQTQNSDVHNSIAVIIKNSNPQILIYNI